jgi:hypothetical protein
MWFSGFGCFFGFVVEKACFAFVFEPIALAFDVDDGGAMQEAVESGAGHDGVTSEDMSPFGKGLIGSDDCCGVFLVTVANDLEEHCSARLIEAEITDFVDDKEPWLGEHLHGMGQPVLFEGGTKATCHFKGGEEERSGIAHAYIYVCRKTSQILLRKLF